MVGWCCVITLTTAGRALAAAWTMAESSVIVTPLRRLTCCVLVRAWNRKTASVTPAATMAVTRSPAVMARMGRMGLMLGSRA